MNKKTGEKTTDERIVYKGKIYSILLDTIELPNGKTIERERLKYPKAACILAITDEGNILMEKQYRTLLNKYIYELPAGKVEDGETPKDAVIRELEEETGYKAGKLEHYTDLYTVASFSNEPIYIFKATELKKTKQNLEEDEFLDVYEMSPDEIKKLLEENKLVDAKTSAVVARYLLEYYLK